MKSATIIRVSIIGYLALSSACKVYNLDLFLAIRHKLNLTSANAKENALPIPSVQPVMTAHDPRPYLAAHSTLIGVIAILMSFTTVDRPLMTYIRPTRPMMDPSKPKD